MEAALSTFSVLYNGRLFVGPHGVNGWASYWHDMSVTWRDVTLLVAIILTYGLNLVSCFVKYPGEDLKGNRVDQKEVPKDKPQDESQLSTSFQHGSDDAV